MTDDASTLPPRLSRRELLLVFAFWTAMAVLISVNRLLDPRGQGFRVVSPTVPVTLAFVESYLWALLTPGIFWLAARFGGERGSWVARVLLFLGVGALVVLLVDAARDLVREAVLRPLPRRVPGARGNGFPGGLPLGFPGRGGRFGLFRFATVTDLVTYLGVLFAGIALDVSRRYRARQEESVRLQAEAAHLQTQLAEARLDALRRQLDPHFLFNTLHAVSSLVERDPRGVRRMISRLSELLRYSMEGATAPEIPLERELELLGRYTDIMRIRFQGRLEVETRVDDRVRVALVPNLVLQPLVENAIKHGTSRVEGVGRIAVEAELSDDGRAVVLRVRDNGPGGAADAIDAEGAEASGGGLGVRNTVARLAQLYGDAGHFALRAASNGESGAVAELRLPFHTTPGR